jgi:hypothetical protein
MSTTTSTRNSMLYLFAILMGMLLICACLFYVCAYRPFNKRNQPNVVLVANENNNPMVRHKNKSYTIDVVPTQASIERNGKRFLVANPSMSKETQDNIDKLEKNMNSDINETRQPSAVEKDDDLKSAIKTIRKNRKSASVTFSDM